MPAYTKPPGSASNKTVGAHPIDKHVGRRIRQRRKQLGWNLQELAEKLGTISWQQLQKYETAENRVSCSRLYQFSRALDCPIMWFFEDLEIGGDSDAR